MFTKQIIVFNNNFKEILLIKVYKAVVLVNFSIYNCKFIVNFSGFWWLHLKEILLIKVYKTVVNYSEYV